MYLLGVESIFEELMRKSINFFKVIDRLFDHTRNEKLNDRFKMLRCADRCVVLGNGPSLAESLLKNSVIKLLKTSQIMCVNSFWKSDYFKILQPEFMFFFDPLFFTKLEEVNDLHAKKIILGTTEALKNVNWSLNVFFPSFSKASCFVNEISDNGNLALNFLNNKLVRDSANDNERFLAYSKWQAMPLVQTVLIAAIYVAITLRFDEVYIFGADHSWHENYRINSEGTIFFEDPHFYVDNDAHRTKFKSIGEDFLSMGRAFIVHEELKRYADYMNVKLYNSSEKSYIDAYDRKIFENCSNSHKAEIVDSPKIECDTDA